MELWFVIMSKENKVTSGGIETANEGFMGNITTSSPFDPRYGDHKKPGSQMAPIRTAGRGGSSMSIRGKLNDVNFKGGKR